MGRLKDFFSKNSAAKGETDPVNQHDRLGLTPLMHAVIAHDSAKVYELLDNGANVNAGSAEKTMLGLAESVDYPKNVTAMHLLAFYPHPVIAEQLLKKGGDVNQKDATGHTAFDYAISMRQYFGGQKHVNIPLAFGRKEKMAKAEASADAVIDLFIKAGAEPNRVRVPDSIEKKRQKFLEEKKQQKQGPGPSVPGLPF